MTAEKARTLLEDLDSDDWSAVCEAVETAGDRLRRRRIDGATTEAIGERLYRLAVSLPFIPSCLATTARLSGTDIILSQWIL